MRGASGTRVLVSLFAGAMSLGMAASPMPVVAQSVDAGAQAPSRAAAAPSSPARLEGKDLSISEIQEHMQARDIQIGPAPARSVQQAALDRALRTRLFAAEAARRGMRAPAGSRAMQRAYLSQALAQSEAERLGIEPEVVDDAQALADAEARAYFDAHTSSMLRFGSVAVRLIVVAEEARAQALLRKYQNSSASQFSAAASRHSLDAASGGKGGYLGFFDHVAAEDLRERFGPSAQLLIFALRRTGEVGYARTSKGQYAVVRAEDVILMPEPWSAALAHRARALMLLERRDRALDELDRRLRRTATIAVDEAALAQIPLP